MPRFRPHFSLLTALLMVTIAGMAMVVTQLWREIGPLRSEVRALRDETGVLTVGDATKLHAIQVRTNNELSWKWRFWIPLGMDVSLKFKWDEVPLHGYPTPDVVKPHLRPGEQWVSVSVQRDQVSFEGERASEGWQCFLECSRTGDTILPIPRSQQWFLHPMGGFFGEGVGTMSKLDDDDDGTNAFLLQRYRVEPAGSQTSAMDDPNDLPGFIIWLEQQ